MSVRRLLALVLSSLGLTGCLFGGEDYIPSTRPPDAGPPPPMDAGSPDAETDTPAEARPSWPFDYAPADDRAFLFSNFPEALTVDNLAESPTGVAFFRAEIEAGTQYRLVFDHFNRTSVGETALEKEGLPPRCHDPSELDIYFHVQAVAETARDTVSRVTVVRQVTEEVKVEASQEPFRRFFASDDVGATAGEMRHPELFEHRLVERVRPGGLFVGAVDFNVVGDAPSYVVSLVASRKHRANPNLTGLRYHGYAHTECMKPSDWRRQYMGALESSRVEARIPLLLRCDDSTEGDNTIFHGEGDHEPLTRNPPGTSAPGGDGYPLFWGTHAHYELDGEARPRFWADRGS